MWLEKLTVLTLMGRNVRFISICLNSPAIPDPPENLRWRDKSASSIFLTWEPPKYDGGSGIRGYNIDRCQRGTDKWEPCGDLVPETKFKVTGLIEGQWYAYRVRALNRLGASQPCKATDEIQAVDPKGMLKLS